MNNTPYLNFKVRSSRDTALYINVLRKNGADDYSDKTEIKLADLKAGVAAEVQIAFADLPGLSALVNDEGVFHLGGTGFKTAGFGENDTFEYDHFYATSQKAEGGEMKVAPACFDADKTSSWYASDQYDGTENWRCLITVADGVWTYRLKDKGGWDAGYVEANKNLITVDTAVTPYLNYKVKADKDTTLYIGKRVNDDWVRIPYATVKAGVLTEGQVKIADIPGIGEYLQDGRLVLDSTRLRDRQLRRRGHVRIPRVLRHQQESGGRGHARAGARRTNPATTWCIPPGSPRPSPATGGIGTGIPAAARAPASSSAIRRTAPSC